MIVPHKNDQQWSKVNLNNRIDRAMRIDIMLSFYFGGVLRRAIVGNPHRSAVRVSYFCTILKYNGEIIVWSGHARDYAERRGFLPIEVENAVREMEWNLNDRGKLECRKDFAFDAVWNRKHYRMKQVRPIFAVEKGTITIITVYTYFF